MYHYRSTPSANRGCLPETCRTRLGRAEACRAAYAWWTCWWHGHSVMLCDLPGTGIVHGESCDNDPAGTCAVQFSLSRAMPPSTSCCAAMDCHWKQSQEPSRDTVGSQREHVLLRSMVVCTCRGKTARRWPPRDLWYNEPSEFFRSLFWPPPVEKNLLKLRTVCVKLKSDGNVLFFRLDTEWMFSLSSSGFIRVSTDYPSLGSDNQSTCVHVWVIGREGTWRVGPQKCYLSCHTHLCIILKYRDTCCFLWHIYTC